MSGHLYYESRDITPAKLNSKNLIMAGRVSPTKIYYLNIEDLKYIIKKVPDHKLTNVSDSD